MGSRSRTPAIGVWSRFNALGGEESVIVDELPSGGLTAQGIAQARGGTSGGGSRIVASRSHPLCGGTIRGWEVVSTTGSGAYAQTVDEIFAVDASTAYRVEYERAGVSTPSAGAVAALRSFCPTQANVTKAVVTRGAIVTPESWHAFDVSSRYHRPSGSAIMYAPPSGSRVREAVILFRQDSPDGVNPDVDADIKYSLDFAAGKEPYTILSQRGVTLCDSGNDGWEVVTRVQGRHVATVRTTVFAFGSEDESANPDAIRAIESLCPGRETAK